MPQFSVQVIALLARTYKLGNGTGREQARAACERNLSVALESGLQCRASVWSVVLSLLSQAPDTPEGTLTRGSEGEGSAGPPQEGHAHRVDQHHDEQGRGRGHLFWFPEA